VTEDMHEERGNLVLIGLALVAAFGFVLIAALPPSLRSAYESPAGPTAVNTIGHHLTIWKVASTSFAIGAALLLVGLSALTARIKSAISVVALALYGTATALWIVNLVFRLTVTVHVAGQTVAAGSVPPGWYEDIRFFADDGLLNAFAVIGGPALFLYGIAVIRTRALAAWSGGLAITFAALMVALYLGREVVPAVMYLGALPLGVSALIAALRPTATRPR
jgi:hypothetical protein